MIWLVTLKRIYFILSIVHLVDKEYVKRPAVFQLLWCIVQSHYSDRDNNCNFRSLFAELRSTVFAWHILAKITSPICVIVKSWTFWNVIFYFYEGQISVFFQMNIIQSENESRANFAQRSDLFITGTINIWTKPLFLSVDILGSCYI